MRGTSPNSFLAIVSALALTAACAPEGEAPVVKAGPVVDAEVSSAGNYLAGRQAQKNRDFNNASRFLGRALEDNPENTLLLRNTFLARLADGDIAAAVPMAEEIVKRQRSAPVAKMILLVDAVERKDMASAEKLLAEFPNRGFSGFMKPLLESWVRIGKSDGDGAIKALAPLKKQSGLRVLYELHAALLSDAAGMSDRAAGHYKLAAQNVRRSTLRVVQGYGQHLERAGKTEEARELYNTYLKENPESVVLGPALARLNTGQKPSLLVSTPAQGIAEALFNLAGTMTRQSSAQTALIYGQLALHLRPDFDVARMLIAGILESMNRNGDAIAEYRDILPTSPFYWSARLRIAGNLEALDRDDVAIELLQKLTTEDATRAEPLVSLGDLLRSNKRFEESVDAYDRAIDLLTDIDKRHWTILYSRGISLERSKQWERAERDFKRALELNPDQPYVLNYLGYSWVDQGINLERARKMIVRAVELRPNDGYIVDSLGWVLYRMKDFDGAVRHLERAVELRPNDPTINDHLGDAYWRVGRYIEARFQWQRALALKPEEDQISAIEDKLLRGLTVSDTGEKDS